MSLNEIKFIPYKQRVFKWFKSTDPRCPYFNDDELYSWMINEWIPKQPDSNTLMRIFILLDFDIRSFIKHIGPSGGGGSRKKVAA